MDEIKAEVDKIEAECPVAKRQGVSGIGEGLVLTSTYKGDRLIFKVKGDKHSVTKDKLKVDPEKVKMCQNFADYTVTKNRVEQAVFELGIDPSKKDTGKVVQWVCNDIKEEESHQLHDLNLMFEDAKSYVSRSTANLFFDIFNL